jgi:hypothetical protein
MREEVIAVEQDWDSATEVRDRVAGLLRAGKLTKRYGARRVAYEGLWHVVLVDRQPGAAPGRCERELLERLSTRTGMR